MGVSGDMYFRTPTRPKIAPLFSQQSSLRHLVISAFGNWWWSDQALSKDQHCFVWRGSDEGNDKKILKLSSVLISNRNCQKGLCRTNPVKKYIICAWEFGIYAEWNAVFYLAMKKHKSSTLRIKNVTYFLSSSFFSVITLSTPEGTKKSTLAFHLIIDFFLV